MFDSWYGYQMIVQIEWNGERDFCKANIYKYKNVLFEHTEYILTFISFEDKKMFYDRHKEYQYEHKGRRPGGHWLLDIPDDVTLALLLLGS